MPTPSEVSDMISQIPKRICNDKCDVEAALANITNVLNVFNSIINKGSLIAKCSVVNSSLTDCVPERFDVADFTLLVETPADFSDIPTPPDAANYHRYALSTIGGTGRATLVYDWGAQDWLVETLEEKQKSVLVITIDPGPGDLTFTYHYEIISTHGCDDVGTAEVTLDLGTTTARVIDNFQKNGCTLEAEFVDLTVLAKSTVGYSTVVDFDEVVYTLVGLSMVGCSFYGTWIPVVAVCTDSPITLPLTFDAEDICLCCDGSNPPSDCITIECVECDIPSVLTLTFTSGTCCTNGGTITLTYDAGDGFWSGSTASACDGGTIHAKLTCDAGDIKLFVWCAEETGIGYAVTIDDCTCPGFTAHGSILGSATAGDCCDTGEFVNFSIVG